MSVKKLQQHDVMTVERLREHLFGGPQVPFWNYDPAQITIGMEIEYFIAHVKGESFTLATKAEYLQVMDHLKHDAGYKDYNLYDQPGRVSRDTELGFIAIKPDFAWHILEISLPPRKKIEDLRTLLQTVFGEVDRALAKVGLERLDISCLPEVPEKMELVELDRLNMFSKSVNQRNNSNQLIEPFFPALIAATHVHLNASNERVFSYLPILFEIERSTIAIYNRATMFSGKIFSNVRDQFLLDTMGSSYKLKGLPERTPKDLHEYVFLMNSSNHAFPHDRFFPVRDVTYIRPSKYGTLEFRSSCSTISIEGLIEIALWRKVHLYAAFLSHTVSTDFLSSITNSIDKIISVDESNANIYKEIERKIQLAYHRSGEKL